MDIEVAKKAVLVCFFCAYVTTVWSVDFSSYSDRGPTRSGEINYFIIEKDYFSKWETNVRQRVRLYEQAWGMATRSTPVSNRDYLFALAIDLYNTIPPDLMPEPREVDQSDADDPNYHINEIEQESIKGQLWFKMSGLEPKFSKTLSEKQDRWEYMKRRFPSERHPAIIELKYLTNYLTEQIKKGNIVLDAHDAPASLPPEKLDITNPTYYEPLRDYMDRMQPAIEAGVPPWEAEKYLATEQSDEKPEQDKPAAQQKPVVNPEPQPENETAAPDVSEEAEYKRYIMILALLAVGIAVIVYIIRRPRKK